MTITTRHISKKWPEWVDWNVEGMSRVPTMCGARVAPKYTGIPGVTKQRRVVYKGGNPVWGWCSKCVLEMMPYLFPSIMSIKHTPEQIIQLHGLARAEIIDQYNKIANNSVP